MNNKDKILTRKHSKNNAETQLLEMLHKHIQRLRIQYRNENEFICIKKLANSKLLRKNIINQICIKSKLND